MPLPTDEELLKTGSDLVAQMQAIFGLHPGFRPAHARGALLTGSFTPSQQAAALSSAPHFSAPSTPILARFSSSTGIPQIPDTDPNANPRGLAIRFNLPSTPDGRRAHTDIIAHTTPSFPTRTGAEFLEFLRAAAASPPGAESPTAVEKFLGAHPDALAFVQTPKPSPVSFASAAYFGVNALRFVGGEGGKGIFFRYRIVPAEGEVKTLDAEEVKGKADSYLFDELATHLGDSGPIKFKLLAQIARPEEGDVVDDATKLWPDSRELVELGEVTLDELVEEEEGKEMQKNVIFDPIPRVQGIKPSEDPLLEMRAAVYLISGRQRRAAGPPKEVVEGLGH
ncbi:hypothetical protein H2201_006074 [Coniosporium apollinis]|uniref:Catalase core domain-containing protein n=1 Tax=Coniosporium apollinis TaxID=61459 RepID=A0ABQ9NQ30_9PEZI|nr:hypothetical protein H2201_006074 [Coniosporium apollinis]